MSLIRKDMDNIKIQCSEKKNTLDGIKIKYYGRK